MPSKSTRRNPLLIPLIVIFLLALIAVGLLGLQWFHLSRESAQLHDDNLALQASVDVLTAERDAFSSQLDAASANLTAASDEKTSAEASVATLTSQVDTLTASLAAEQEKVAALEADKTKLAASLTTAEEGKTAAEASVATLTGARDALTAENGMLATANDALTAELNTLTANLASTQTALHAAMDEVTFAQTYMVQMLGKTASAQGFNGPVSVTAVVSEQGVVAYLTIEASCENAGLGQKVMDPRYMEQFIGKTLPLVLGENVDAVTGATVTSQAVVDALNLLTPEYATPHDNLDAFPGDG